MSESLNYFKNVYDVVPDWILRLDEQSPKMLDCYTAIRGESFASGALTVKEKDMLVAMSNAGRLYRRSMLYHTKGAVGGKATVAELAECALVAYLYGGLPSFRLSLESLSYASQLWGRKPCALPGPDATATEVIDKMLELIADEGSNPAFLLRARGLLQETPYQKAADELLSDGLVPRRLKYLLMIGCYVSQLDGRGAEPWIKAARRAGVSEEQLAELGYVCIMTAGIPAWFELSDSLLKKAPDPGKL